MKNIYFSPVYLRAKKNASGKNFFFLDIVKDAVRYKESLQFYLVLEVMCADKVVNQKIMRNAKEVKAKRLVELLEGKVSVSYSYL